MDEPPLDLTAEPQTPRAAGFAQRDLAIGPYDPTRLREGVRSWIAGALVALFVLVILGLIWGVMSGRIPPEQLQAIGATVISPLVGLLGAVLGFYFGEQHGRGR